MNGIETAWGGVIIAIGNQCQGTPFATGLVNPNPYGFTAAMVGGGRPPCTGDVR